MLTEELCLSGFFEGTEGYSEVEMNLKVLEIFFLTQSYVDTQVAECILVMYKRKFRCCICCMSFTDNVCRSVCVTQTLSDNNVTVIGLLTDGEEAEYREEVKTLSVWCQENNISLNKTKDMITD